MLEAVALACSAHRPIEDEWKPRKSGVARDFESECAVPVEMQLLVELHKYPVNDQVPAARAKVRCRSSSAEFVVSRENVALGGFRELDKPGWCVADRGCADFVAIEREQGDEPVDVASQAAAPPGDGQTRLTLACEPDKMVVRASCARANPGV